VTFKVVKKSWRIVHDAWVDPSKPETLQQEAAGYVQRGWGIFDSTLHTLNARTCADIISNDKLLNSIYLIRDWKIEVDESRLPLDDGKELDDGKDIHKRNRY